MNTHSRASIDCRARTLNKDHLAAPHPKDQSLPVLEIERFLFLCLLLVIATGVLTGFKFTEQVCQSFIQETFLSCFCKIRLKKLLTPDARRVFTTAHPKHCSGEQIKDRTKKVSC